MNSVVNKITEAPAEVDNEGLVAIEYVVAAALVAAGIAVLFQSLGDHLRQAEKHGRRTRRPWIGEGDGLRRPPLVSSEPR